MKTELTVEDLEMIWLVLLFLNAKHQREGGYKVKEHEKLLNKVWKVILETDQYNKKKYN